MVSILIRFTKDFAKDDTPTKGDEVSVTSTLVMSVADAVISYFNIPVPSPEELQEALGARATTVAGFTYTRYSGLDDATGKEVTVPEFERTSGGGGRGTIKNVAQVPLITKKTAKENYRMTSFKFPSYFSIIMIDQAIGSMIKANEPPSYKLRGKTRIFVPNASTAPFTGLSSGAWVTGTFDPAVNAESSQAVGEATVTKSGRQSTAAPTPTP